VTVGRLIVAGGVLAAAMLGLAISLGVPARPAANPRARFPWRGPWDTVRDLAHMRSDKLLAGIVALDAYVWFVAALQVLLINRMGKQFHLDKADTSFMLAPELAGVALGGLVIGKLSGSRRWFRVLAPAALAMGAVMLAVAGTPALPNQEQGISPQFIAACALFFFTGLAGGILLVPLEAFIQARPAPDRKGQVIAAANFTAFIGIMLAGLADIILGWYMSPTAAFGLLGAATLLAGAVVWKATKQTIDAKPQAEGQSNT
jgi:acyl-[acyl-carrier-protein]-phospholipid O-acyltransferase/long-chain-fatty-acid--[acyl-carrier-protein] ligase